MRKFISPQNQWLQKSPQKFCHSSSIKKGPFITTPMYSSPNEEYIKQSQFQQSVLKSFKFAFISFLKAVQAKNMQIIKNITRPNLSESMQDYLDYLNRKKKKISLQNIDDFQITIENIVGMTYIYGLPLQNKDKFDQYKEIQMKRSKPNQIERAYYINKNVLRHKREKLILVDLIISTNLKPQIVSTQKNDEENQNQQQLEIQQSSSKYNNYLVQFITNSVYYNYDVPYIIDEEKWKDLLGDEYFDSENSNYSENIVNTQFISSSKQEQYETLGWKINNINSYIQQPSLYHAV